MKLSLSIILFSAAIAGTVSFAAAPQAPDGEMCAGIAGIACAKGSYCSMDVGQCRVLDGAGICKKKPDICTEREDPVCGCDNKTYGNACKAARAGVNVGQKGACK